MKHTLRIATFNLENFDDKPRSSPTLAHRIAVMRPQISRLNADILCLQEVHGQETEGEPRKLLALDQLLEGTQYIGYHRVSTTTMSSEEVYDVRNLVVLSRYDILSYHQCKHDHIQAPEYRKVMAQPPEEEASTVEWERPILKVEIQLPDGQSIHVLNVHLKSKLPTTIKGQKKNTFTWKTVGGWAEGYFISSMKRVGQALEARVVIDEILDADPNAYLVVCGDFNAEQNDVPVMAIRGDVEQTGNSDLVNRILVPCENGIPESSRYSLFYRGKGQMIDHLLVTRNMLEFYTKAEIHNEVLHDESISNATDKKFPESDHAPVVAEFVME